MPDDPNGNNLFRRLVERTAQARPVTQKPVPSTDYTRDVIARGSQAVLDRAKGLSFDKTQGTQGLDWAQQTGLPVNDPTDAYMEWYASKGFQPSGGPVTFGQTPKGAYSGFKTEGDLKAAITGRADQERMQDRDTAQQQFNDASGTLNQLGTAYDQQRTQKDQEVASLAPSVAGMGLGHTEGSGAPAGWGVGTQQHLEDRPATLDPSTHAIVPAMNGVLVRGTDAGHLVGPRPGDDTQAAADADRVMQLDAHGEQLKQWLATSAQPELDTMNTARQIGNTPLRDYQQQAGSQYGVDPNITAGWFPESTDVTDYTNQRNLQSINDYGVPYSDFQGYLADQQQQQDAAAKQQTTDQAAADKQATAAQAAQISDIVGQATGLDANQLEQSVNMTPDQVAQVVTDPTYQQATADLNSVVQADGFDPNGKDDVAAVNAVLDQPAIRQNPQLLAILLQVYSDYIG